MPRIEYRTATLNDIGPICRFTDFWLAGRGLRSNAPGAVNDYFISPSQHKKYITKYTVQLALLSEDIIAWAVKQPNGTLTHLLVAGNMRGQGIGWTMLQILDPPTVHSKSDQSSGNPGPFYEKHGYKKTATIKSRGRLDIDRIRPNRPKNIDIYERKTCRPLQKNCPQLYP